MQLASVNGTCEMTLSSMVAARKVVRRSTASGLFSAAICLMVSLLLIPLACAQRPPKEEKPQALASIPDAPSAVKVQTSRLNYLQMDSEDRGLLSKQVEESLKTLRKQLRRRRLVRITAWVGGAGDVRRVSSSIREQLSGWRIPSPAITVIRVGALANPATRVAFEVEVEEERPVNPFGLVYLAGARESPDEFQMNLSEDLQRALSTLGERLDGEGDGATVMSVRCFVSLNGDLASLDKALHERFPQASTRVMQASRSTPNSFVNCEMVARLATEPAEPFEAKVVTLVEGEPPITSLVKVNSQFMVLTAGQLCFRSTDDDLGLGFERLESTLQEQGTSLSHAAHLSIFAQSSELGIRAEEQGRKFLNPLSDPAILRQTVEALPALDSTVSLEATVAVIE